VHPEVLGSQFRHEVLPHSEIADRAVDLCLVGVPAPRRILDVGCGTGSLLRQLAARVPTATRLVGVDAAPSMISVAEAAATDARVRFSAGTAEHLPHPDAGFDLVVTTTSFDHWANQQAGLGECARVLKPGGRLVLADLFSAWLLPTLLLGRAGKARTPRAATHLLTTAGPIYRMARSLRAHHPSRHRDQVSALVKTVVYPRNPR
jgi:ubiquinone/menaquinone biosynthesis C-methylase UbiE